MWRKFNMLKLNAIEKSHYINSKYKEYLSSSFRFGSEGLQSLFEEQLDVECLFKGPYLDLSLPFERGRSINELIKSGILCDEFKNLGDINSERPLYYHQEMALKLIGAGRSAVVTTGTGSGKTESFLYPIVNNILKDIENGNNASGIRAIFLYPMNALVNDQMDRVRKLLCNYPDITFGSFTGNTPESEKDTIAYRLEYERENGVKLPANELVSRESIRNNPPHLLFTNYSMLEYLMIRPKDCPIFSEEKLHSWKYVVLDEAHSYSGALGIEISMLMRRLTGLAECKPNFILTSATLGKQGQSEDDIVSFANKLTSRTFTKDDIIFAKRIPFDMSKSQIVVSGDVYTYIKQHIDDFAKVKEACERYITINCCDVNSCLYDLLSQDCHVAALYNELKTMPKKAEEIFKRFATELTVEKFVDLVDLINLAEKDGVGLFDLKYHSFVRPLAGAYITLGGDMEVSLVKTNMINGFKAFELANCHYCNAPYIVGQIRRNLKDKLYYLFQNNEIDIYENYGDNSSVKLDYFLMELPEEQDENVDKGQPTIVRHKVCVKCGAIYESENLNAEKCECNEKYEIELFKVVNKSSDDSPKPYNNITFCPSCGNKKNTGIVKTLNLGKDAGTTLISQILYESIDEQENDVLEPVVAKQLFSGIKKRQNQMAYQEKTKQFLTFSDSRQQASFFSVFADVSNTRMLRKRLIWKMIEDRNYESIGVSSLVSGIMKLMEDAHLPDHEMSYEKNAWLAVLIDLLKVDGNYDGSGVGLYYFDLNMADVEAGISEDEVQDFVGQYGLDKADLLNVVKVIFEIFKFASAIDYSCAGLLQKEISDNLEYRRFNNSVQLKCESKSQKKNVRSLLPKGANLNSSVRYILKVCGCTVEKANEILEVIFDDIGVGSGILKSVDNTGCYQINVEQYVLKNYKKNKFYKCKKCGKLTPYNVLDVCPRNQCLGKLIEIDPDIDLAKNYYRTEYKKKKIESIVIKEHTAQLERKKARQYQKDFKNKKINILSCSTTFEMGIDIGDLETVLMRNVPPSPANYVQRAGRAGRRKDSSAYILTYCGVGSHDYSYFAQPEHMISGIVSPPYFNVENPKIIVRHLLATCLGQFFKENPQYFKNIELLVFGDGLEKFNKFILSNPDNLNKYINNKVLPEDKFKEFHNFKWFINMGGEDEKMSRFVECVQAIEAEYIKALNHAKEDENYDLADKFKALIHKLRTERTIEMLSKYCVIPKYGFPVDVVDLQVYSNGVCNNKIDMTRDLKIAISEYAPDSEIIADGKKYVSRYITLPKVSSFARNYYCICPVCNNINVGFLKNDVDACQCCGESLLDVPVSYFIEPTYGFKAVESKDSTQLKPKRSYSGEVTYLGGGKKDEEILSIKNVINVETSTDDELLVLNKSCFYFCPTCGYSHIVKGPVIPSQACLKHKNYREYDCKNEKLELVKLGHRFRTDVAHIYIPYFVKMDNISYARALSFLYAFLEGISIALGIERHDINGILESKSDGYSFVIYDNVPGGAGHSKRLLLKENLITSLEAALLKVSYECCDVDTSCNNCLRNYYNQSHHEVLKRNLAIESLEMILNNL